MFHFLQLSSRVVTVDGFTDPGSSNDRICLGLLSNVNRNGTVENTRKHIGRGIQLEYSSANNLTLYNNSEAPVFVQSRNCNFVMKADPSAVMRVPPHSRLNIFDQYVSFEVRVLYSPKRPPSDAPAGQAEHTERGLRTAEDVSHQDILCQGLSSPF